MPEQLIPSQGTRQPWQVAGSTRRAMRPDDRAKRTTAQAAPHSRLLTPCAPMTHLAPDSPSPASGTPGQSSDGPCTALTDKDHS
jgi:hypothetical protein